MGTFGCLGRQGREKRERENHRGRGVKGQQIQFTLFSLTVAVVRHNFALWLDSTILKVFSNVNDSMIFLVIFGFLPLKLSLTLSA